MLSLCLPGSSWLHRWPAAVKFGVLAAVMLVLAFTSALPVLAGAVVVTAGLYASLGRRGVAAARQALRPLVWIIGLIAAWMLWQGDGLGAVQITLRIIAMVGFANLVTLTTPLAETMALVERLCAPLGRFGLNPRLPALALALALRFVPVLGGRMEALGLAWRARSSRRPGPRLLVPLTLTLLDDSERVADALRARGGLTPPTGPSR